MSKKKDERVVWNHGKKKWFKGGVSKGKELGAQWKGKTRKTDEEDIKASLLSAFIDTLKSGIHYDSQLLKLASSKGVDVNDAERVWSSCKDELINSLLDNVFATEDTEIVLRKHGQLKPTSSKKDLEDLLKKELGDIYEEKRASTTFMDKFARSMQQRRSQIKPLTEKEIKERAEKD